MLQSKSDDDLHGTLAMTPPPSTCPPNLPLDVRCPRCPHPSADEARHLQTISLFRHGRALAEADLAIPRRSDAGLVPHPLICATPGLSLVQ